MLNLKYHYSAAPGYTQLVTPETHPINDLDFGMLTLEPGQRYEAESAGCEIGLVILAGRCTMRVDDETFADLGERASVFEGRASGVYVPCQSHFAVHAGPEGVEIAVCRCPTEQRFAAQVVRPADIIVNERGGPGHKRYVHDIFGPQVQAATMLVGETYTIAGNWSSFPPHKHDVEALPDEVQQEELYLYKIRPAEGFGLQFFYSRPDSPRGELDEAVAVRENDFTLMPFGYHPVAAPPGYDVYYLWFLAGPKRLMRPHDDPLYAWIKTAPAEERSYPK
ncbi:MAG TPA: 5-deoxy-glucuronate isomerase [Ktedonobacterales bacterium]|nr:5-deoxy-glucuronate isomerase [Ktedonobacterales bacterium]